MCAQPIESQMSVSEADELSDDGQVMSSEDECHSSQPKVVQELPTDTNPFSEPLEDSDLVLVVENEKFHVHRLILTLNSPVFKVMLKSDFKEARRDEITLPKKDPREVLDLLKQLYPHVRAEITMNSVGHILKLADEYQMTSVLDLCGNFLKIKRKREHNAMRILLLAQRYKLDTVAEDCRAVLAKMTLQDLEEYDEFEELDGKNLREILLPRLRKLENGVSGLRAEVAGLLACATWLWSQAKMSLPWCPVHYKNGKSCGSLEARLRDCDACKNVIESFTAKTGNTSRHASCAYTSSVNECITDNFLPVLKQLFDLTDDDEEEEEEEENLDADSILECV